MPRNDVQLTIGAKDRTKNALKSVRSGLNQTVKAAGLLGTATVAAMAALVNQSRQAQDEIGKLSTRLGISTEALSQYKHIAELSGISFQTLTMGFQRQTRRIAEAAQGYGEARGALKELGLEAGVLNRLSPEMQFERITEAMSGVTNQADKVRLAMKLFDSEGVALIQTMDMSAEAIEKAKQQVIDYGAALDGFETKQIEEMNDELTSASLVMDGISKQLTLQLSPFIRQMAVDFQDSAKAGKGFGGVIEKVIENLIGGIGFMADAWRGLEFIWKGLQLVFAHVAEFILDEIHTIMTGWNDLKALFGFEPDPNAGIQGVLTEAKNRTTELKDELAALVTQEMPSDIINEWAENAKIQMFNVSQAAKDAMGNGEDGEQTKLSFIMSDDEFEAEFERAEKQFTGLNKLYSGNQGHFSNIWKKGLEEREKFQKKSGGAQVAQAMGDFGKMISGATQSNKTLFNINKMAGIANAIVNTAEGVTKSLSAYPYPISIAMAAGSLAAGLAQINTIKAQQFGSGGSPSLPSGGGVSSEAIAETTTTTGEGAEAITTSQKTTITLNISSGIYDHNALIELAENLSELAGDGLDVRATVV